MMDEQLKYLTTLGKALSCPKRAALLLSVMTKPSTVGDLALALDVAQATVSHYVRGLAAAGLVRVTVDGVGHVVEGTGNDIHIVLLDPQTGTITSETKCATGGCRQVADRNK